MLLLIITCGCSTGDDSSPETESPDNVPALVVADYENLSPVFGHEGGTTTISFTAGADWSATLSNSRADEWLSITPATGKKGKGVITIQVQPNETPDELNATIILKSGVVTESIVVTQKQKNALTITSDKIEVSASGGEVEVEVIANIDFDVKLLVEWIKEPGTRALNTSNLSFFVEENQSGVLRVGHIVVNSGALSDTVTIYQDFERFITLTDRYFALPDTGGTVEVEINSSVDFNTRFLSGADWVREKATRALSTHTLYYEVSAHNGDTPREARILFYDKANETLNNTVTIYQSERGASHHITVERKALMSLYDATNGSQWAENTHWGSDSPLERWYGVEMTGGRVTGLRLSNNNLIGSLPDGISQLDHIAYISLGGNRISGDIPAGISDLKHLSELHLEDNYLTGAIPVGFAEIATLDTLKLRGNCLSGKIPSLLFASDKWENVWNINDILPQREGFELTYGIYESTDFSEDGRVHLLNRHTKGKGIKVVAMGDGYSDRMIADGTYMQTMRRAMEEFFELEPYRSHREYFDFYAVTAVSRNEYIDRIGNQPSAFGTTFNGNSINDNVTLFGSEAYLKKMDELKGKNGRISLSDVVTMVIMNNNTYNFRSFCAMYSDGFALALCFQAGNEEGIVAHEAGGHGFGKLADEYVEQGNNGTPPENELEKLIEWQKNGWFNNVDTTSNPQDISWNKFLSDERYAMEGIGIYQGAYYYPKGVYRPNQNSIMRYHWEGDGYNAPSRLMIFNRIKRLAGEEYTFDDFLLYDEINRNTFRSRFSRDSSPAEIEKRLRTTAPPQIMDYPSSERLRRAPKQSFFIPVVSQSP